MMVIVVESAVGTGQLKRKKKSAIGTERPKRQQVRSEGDEP
jgi:hypothetical protein